MEMRKITDVRILNLNPGETLVVQYQEKLTREKREEIQSALRTLICAENRVLVLDNGTNIGILRRDQVDA